MDSYDTEEYENLPPAPMLLVKVSNPIVPNKSTERKALIDSGASRTAIPDELIEELELVQVREIPVGGYKEEGEQKHNTFFVDVEFDGYSFPFVEAVGVKRSNVLLGRDVLNQIKLVLDGKNLSFEFSDP